MKLFKFKKIIKTEILNHYSGNSEDEEMLNLNVGNMIDGFDGMVAGSVLNDYESPKTTFIIYYDNNTTKTVTVNDGSFDYNKYIKYLK